MKESPAAIGSQDRTITPHALFLAKCRINANLISVIGLTAGAATALMIGLGNFGFAFWLLLLTGLSDVLDGAVARAQGDESELGAFLDSLFDGIVNIVVLLGMAWFFIVEDERTGVLLIFAFLIGAAITIYAQLVGQSFGVQMDKPVNLQGIRSKWIGFAGRPAAFILILAGLATPSILIPMLWILAVSTNLNAILRST